MKAILIFALVAIAACNEFPIEQDLESNAIDTIKCFVEKALPLLPQVGEIITAIKEQDFMTVVVLGMGMYEEIKEMIDVCIPKEQVLAFDFSGFANCAGSVGGAVGVVAQLISHILAKNFLAAAALVPSALSAGGKVIDKCGKFLR